MKHRPVALTGMKHTGKTTIARLLAARLGVPSYDTDVLIAELSGKTPRELADEGGSELMHSWETRAIETLRDRLAGRQAVIATGGGLADNADGFAALKELGACVYLDTDFDTLYDRIEASAQRDGRMPSFLRGPNPRADFRAIFDRRTKIYATMCDIRVIAGGKGPAEIASEISEYLRHG